MEDRNTINTTKDNNKAMSYDDVIDMAEAVSIKMASYNDYPQSATNNAKRARKWKEEMVVIAEHVLGGHVQHN